MPCITASITTQKCSSLSPGNSASSNMITISVNTNGLAGYTLSAAVGDGTTYTDGLVVALSTDGNRALCDVE